jgi:hypothetical protein
VCVCVLALAIRHANRIYFAQHYSVICGLSPSTILFSYYLINGKISEKNLEHKICVLIFQQLLSETFLILRIIHRDFVMNAHRSLCKLPLFLLDFNET